MTEATKDITHDKLIQQLGILSHPCSIYHRVLHLQIKNGNIMQFSRLASLNEGSR